MKKKAGIGLGVLLAVSLIIFGLIRYSNSFDILSPLGIVPEKKEKKYKVMGFLPTWMVGKTQDYCHEVTELVFLGVESDEKGNLIWDGQGNKVNSDSYLKTKSRIRSCGGKNIVGIKLFEDNKIDKLMASEEARKNLLDQINVVVNSGGFDGVNIDFEYQGNPTRILEDEFWGFLGEVRTAGWGVLGIDVMANTVINGPTEQIKRLLATVDEMVIMAYDFHRPGSDFAGSVAPIESVPGERSIAEVAAKIAEGGLDKSKIIMAYPLYGYEWETETVAYGAKTLPGLGWMASFDRVQKLVKSYESGVTSGSEKEIKLNYDELSQTPWLNFKKTEDITKTKWVKVRGRWKKQAYTVPVERVHQIYYDDLRSLKIKMDLVKRSGLAGVGFWALGYEGEDRGIWNLVSGI